MDFTYILFFPLRNFAFSAALRTAFNKHLYWTKSICFSINILFNSFKSKKQLLSRITILEKELEIYKRKQNNNKLKIKQIDRIIFSLLNEKQIRNILRNYISYYNNFRPHRGINQQIPKGFLPQENGNIKSKPILGGLHHHYFRAVA